MHTAPQPKVVCTPSWEGKHVSDDGMVAGECVRVWVIDDQAAFRRATAATLAAMDGFVMAGECDTGESAIVSIGAGNADIVLMDLHMPGMDGIEATRHIRAMNPDVVVVLMSTYDLEDLPAAASNCGATTYLHKERLGPEVLSRIWRTAT